MNRKNFIQTTSLGVVSVIANPFKCIAQTEAEAPYKIEVVKEFVKAGHGNIGKVKEMMQEYPNLVYSRYD